MKGIFHRGLRKRKLLVTALVNKGHRKKRYKVELDHRTAKFAMMHADEISLRGNKVGTKKNRVSSRVICYFDISQSMSLNN